MKETVVRPVAIVTGASMGIGEALVERLAARFYDIVLVARSAEKLEPIAQRINARYGVAGEVVAADLADSHSSERIVAAALDRFGGIDLLVNNAGFGGHGDFTQSDLADQRRMIDVNVGAVVELTHRALPSIRQRRGGVINIASTAAFQPLPHMAVYGATKSFVLSFSEALYVELKPEGVRVLAVCPGATKTNFFAVAGEAAQVGRLRSVDDVVKTTLDAYDGGRMTVVDGPVNRMLSLSQRFLPRTAIARISGVLMRG